MIIYLHGKDAREKVNFLNQLNSDRLPQTTNLGIDFASVPVAKKSALVFVIDNDNAFQATRLSYIQSADVIVALDNSYVNDAEIIQSKKTIFEFPSDADAKQFVFNLSLDFMTKPVIDKKDNDLKNAFELSSTAKIDMEQKATHSIKPVVIQTKDEEKKKANLFPANPVGSIAKFFADIKKEIVETKKPQQPFFTPTHYPIN